MREGEYKKENEREEQAKENIAGESEAQEQRLQIFLANTANGKTINLSCYPCCLRTQQQPQ